MSEIKLVLKILSTLNKKDSRISSNDLIVKYKDILINNPEISETDLINKLYDSNDKSNKFRNLKFRLKDSLYKELFTTLSNQTLETNRAKTEINCSTYFTVSLALLNSGFVDLSMKISMRMLNIAIRFELTDFTLLYLKNIIIFYGYIEPNPVKYKIFTEKRSHFYKLREKEEYVRDIYTKYSTLFTSQKSGLKKSQLEDLSKIVEELSELGDNDMSYIIAYHSFDLICFYYLQIKSYETVIKYSIKGMEIFQSKKFIDMKALYINYCNIIQANIYLNENENADIYVNKCLQIVTKGNIFWCRILALSFINNSIIKNYNKLYDLFQEFQFFDKSKLTHRVIVEEWYIREAYINFLIIIGKIDTQTLEKYKKIPFVISKFLNSIYFSNKDKSGQNFSILLIKILFLLVKRNFNAITDLEDGLKIYRHRYLKKDNTFRSNIMVQMILIMIKLNFNPTRTRRATNDLLMKLNTEPYNISETSVYIEIITYDHLWELILEVLESNHKK